TTLFRSLAIVLSMVVLFAWQCFVAGPQMEQAQRRAAIEAEQQAAADQGLATPSAGEGAPVIRDGTGAQVFADRADAIAASPRVAIDTPALAGSINLRGARIDDLRLKQYRETVDPDSPIITLLSPAGAPGAYYAEQGWAPAAGADVAMPDAESAWTVEGESETLGAGDSVTLRWENGAGLVFRRTFTIDDHYLFTIAQTVENQTAGDVAFYPYARVVRHGTPPVQNFFIQHEGPLGVLGSNNLVARKYGDLQNDKVVDASSDGGWVGITDKYWATTVLAEPDAPINARLSYTQPGQTDVYQTSFVETAPVVVPAGGTSENTSYVFAGAKEEAVIASYEQAYGFDRLELLIDWGWLHFITKPMFHLLTFLYGILGNFGLAILAVTVIVKAIFFPRANRSYRSMAAMRRVQPEMKAIQERYKEDR